MVKRFLMLNTTQTLFAIYKKGNHLGNEKGVNENAAIKNYLIAAFSKKVLNDKEFVSLYSAQIAIKEIHFL
tara:strand:+ start:3372 stop:3584 length:213 start_codon:yes stop_codon:yes gene_type:complete